MSVQTRRIPLPAPTESSAHNQYSSIEGEEDDYNDNRNVYDGEAATDLSRRTDRTSYSVPDDGSPLIIQTSRGRSSSKEGGNTAKATKSGVSGVKVSNASHTSLLIEYFESGKRHSRDGSGNAKPSVRVKVRPSSSTAVKRSSHGDVGEDHIQITAAKSGTNAGTSTRRISLGGKDGLRVEEGSLREVRSAESSSLRGDGPPIEIEVFNGSDMSSTIGLPQNRSVLINPSDVSSMPGDSVLDATLKPLKPTPTKSSKDDMLKAPPKSEKERSVSRERQIAQLAAAKLGKESRERRKASSERRERKQKYVDEYERNLPSPDEKGRSSSKTKERARAIDAGLAAGAAGLTAAALMGDRSKNRRSGDRFETESQLSTDSTRNPKLLQTVEDAIARLMPEVRAMKEEKLAKGEQSAKTRPRDVDVEEREAKESFSRRKSSRRSSDHKSVDEHSSVSEASLDRPGSEERSIRSPGSDRVRVRRRRSKEQSNAPSAALAAGAAGTAAALAMKEFGSPHSRSSMEERREKRRIRREEIGDIDSASPRVKSGTMKSPALSTVSNDDVFAKHDVPRMPMASDVGSDLTRESILSERTASPDGQKRRTEIREFVRGAPIQTSSPLAKAPATRDDYEYSLDSPKTRTTLRDLGTQHENKTAKTKRDFSFEGGNRDEDYISAGTAAAAGLGMGGLAAAALSPFDTDHGFNKGRQLSPIASVASLEERSESSRPYGMVKNQEQSSRPWSFARADEPGIRDSIRLHEEPVVAAPVKQARVLAERPRIVDVSDPLSPPPLNIRRSADRGLDTGSPSPERFFEEQHAVHERLRHAQANDESYTTSRSSALSPDHSLDDSYNRLTVETDNSFHYDSVASAQPVKGAERTVQDAEWVHQPEGMGVESAVASLVEPSMVSSMPGSWVEPDAPFARNENVAAGSPLRREVSPPFNKNEDNIKFSATHFPGAGSPIPEIGYLDYAESEIGTNPSIKSPQYRETENWQSHAQYEHDNEEEDRAATPTPADPPRGVSIEDIKKHNEESDRAAANMMNVASKARNIIANMQRQKQAEKNAQNSAKATMRKPLAKDAGLVAAGAGAGVVAEKMASKAYDQYEDDNVTPTQERQGDSYFASVPVAGHKDIDLDEDDETDPFTSKSHLRHLSGYSQGMGSPIYDAATGRGMDRIKSKDIIALMDHLTVRDAARNARDTEILVTLVRSAAEMRNSFDEVKKFIADQDVMMMDHNTKKHDQTVHRVTVGGPRQQPARTSGGRVSSTEGTLRDETPPPKKESVFRRALKGLSGRSSNDLARIEDMLEHLMDEIAELKANQANEMSNRVESTSTRQSPYQNQPAVTPFEQAQNGNAVFAAAGERMASSGALAGYDNTADGSSYRGNGTGARPGSRARGAPLATGTMNRVSTVMEEEDEGQDQPLPRHEDEDDTDVPLETHEQQILGEEYSEQDILTPTRGKHARGNSVSGTPPFRNSPQQQQVITPRTEKNKKSRPFSGISFPKISRWSKTTASSVPETRRSSLAQTGDQKSPGRGQTYYDDDPSRSGSELDNFQAYDHHGDDALPYDEVDDPNRPPSPLIPSQVSSAPTMPLHQANRVSLVMEHPRPVIGAKYPRDIEAQAQVLGLDPVSPLSDTSRNHRYSTDSGNYGSAQRSTKARDDGPLVPPKVPLSPVSPQVDTKPRPASYVDRLQDSEQQASRKPSGPRPLAKGSWITTGLDGVQQTWYRKDTAIPSDIPEYDDTDNEDETF